MVDINKPLKARTLGRAGDSSGEKADGPRDYNHDDGRRIITLYKKLE